MFEHFQYACYCVSRYPEKYKDEINAFVDDLVTYDASATNGYDRSITPKTHLALCAAAGDMKLWYK